jgi:hypothetical protein
VGAAMSEVCDLRCIDRYGWWCDACWRKILQGDFGEYQHEDDKTERDRKEL